MVRTIHALISCNHNHSIDFLIARTIFFQNFNFVIFIFKYFCTREKIQGRVAQLVRAVAF